MLYTTQTNQQYARTSYGSAGGDVMWVDKVCFRDICGKLTVLPNYPADNGYSLDLGCSGYYKCGGGAQQAIMQERAQSTGAAQLGTTASMAVAWHEANRPSHRLYNFRYVPSTGNTGRYFCDIDIYHDPEDAPPYVPGPIGPTPPGGPYPDPGPAPTNPGSPIPGPGEGEGGGSGPGQGEGFMQTQEWAPVRVSLDESGDDLFVDHSLAVTYLPGLDLQIGQQWDISDELDPEPLYQMYVSSISNEGDLENYQFETILSRLNRAYPAPIFVSAEELGYTEEPYTGPGVFEPVNPLGMTPREALEEILRIWKRQASWLEWEPIPEFYLLGPGGLSLSPLGIQILTLTQPEERTQWRSMYSFLEEWFGIFQGYTWRVNSHNRLEILRPYWMDAEPEPVLTLTELDIVGETIVEDAAGIVNRATVRSRAWEFVADQQIMEPAYLVRKDGSPLLVYVAEDEDGNPVTVPIPYHTEYQYGSGENIRARVELPQGALWTLGEGIKTTGEFMKVVFSLKAWEVRTAPGETPALVIDEKDTERLMSVGGTTVIRREHNVGWIELSLFMIEPGVVRVTTTEQVVGQNFIGTQFAYAFFFTLNGLGNKWQQSPVTISATYGLEGDPGNGYQLSQSQYGVVEKVIQSNFWPLSVEDCQAIARSYVEMNMHPSLVYTIEQSAWNAWPVRPHHVGRLVALPDRRMGVLESREYQESHSPGTSTSGSRITVRVVRGLLGPELPDTTPPVITIISPQQGESITGWDFTLTAQATDPGRGTERSGVVSVEVMIGGEWTPLGLFPPDTWQRDFRLDTGAYTLEVRATDGEGNQSTASVSFSIGGFVDNTPPTVTITSPTEGSVV